MSKKRYIILADDDADDRMLFEDAVKEVDEKAKLISSVDGVDLMIMLGQLVPPKPDVIFLDINMPKKNGLECLSQIKSSPILKDIPVVMYSTCAQEDTVNKAFKYGASFYVKKPDSFSALKNIIQKVLSINFNMNNTIPSKEAFIITF